MFFVSIQFVRYKRFVHQFFLQPAMTGSMISWNPGPEPKSGRKKVKAMTTMSGGVSRINRANRKAGRLNNLLSPRVIFQVTKVVNIPLFCV